MRQLKPPIPTSNTASRDIGKDSGERRAALIPVVIALLAIAGLSVYSLWQDAKPRRVKNLVTGQMGYWDMDGGDDRGMNHIADSTGTLDNLMLIRSGDRMLLSEPAGLPTPPEGQRLTGFTRTDGHITEDIVMWSVSAATPQHMADWYVQQAKSLGFQSLATGDGDTANAGSTSTIAVNRVLIRSRADQDGHSLMPADDVLVIRAGEGLSGATRVLLWYRYSDVGRR